MRLLWVLILSSAVACTTSKIETIVIRGSDTEVNLVLKLAEAYMDSIPNLSIAVTGGGSGAGIAALINKKTDIANSSREFKASEKELAFTRQIEVVPFIFATDALCFIVHEELAIDSLTIEQIRDIYTGKTNNWSALGAIDLEVSLYGRQGNSGTFTYIQQRILKDDYSLRMKQMNGTSQIIESIKNDPAGIGYVGIGYVLDKNGKVTEGIKILSIKEEGKKAISPIDPQNIISGDYPVVRPLYQYLDGSPEGVLREFLEFEISAEGQRIISENGYFPIAEQHRKLNQNSLARAQKQD